MSGEGVDLCPPPATVAKPTEEAVFESIVGNSEQLVEQRLLVAKLQVCLGGCV